MFLVRMSGHPGRAKAGSEAATQTTAGSRAAFTSLGRQSTAATEGRADAEQQAAARIEKGSKEGPQRDAGRAQRQAAGQMYRKQAKSPGNSPGRAKEAKHGRQPEAQKRSRKPGRPTAARKGCTCSDSFANTQGANGPHRTKAGRIPNGRRPAGGVPVLNDLNGCAPNT